MMPTENNRSGRILCGNNFFDTSEVCKTQVEKIIGWLIRIRKNVPQCHNRIHKARLTCAICPGQDCNRLDVQVALRHRAEISDYEANCLITSHVYHSKILKSSRIC